MSNRAINSVLDYSELRGSERLLMVIIADGVSKDTGWYIARVDTIARQMNCTKRWVQKLVGGCIAAGELIGGTNEKGDAWAAFFIPIYDGEPGFDPQECDAQGHICTGLHTPLYVSREDAKADEVRRHRMRRKAERKLAANYGSQAHQNVDNSPDEPCPANDSSHPANDSSHPANDSSHPANDSSHRSSIVPSLSPSLTLDVPGASPQKTRRKRGAKGGAA